MRPAFAFPWIFPANALLCVCFTTYVHPHSAKNNATPAWIHFGCSPRLHGRCTETMFFSRSSVWKSGEEMTSVGTVSPSLIQPAVQVGI